MITVLLLLAIAAFVAVLLTAVTNGRVPLWVAVLLLAIAAVLEHVPLGR